MKPFIRKLLEDTQMTMNFNDDDNIKSNHESVLWLRDVLFGRTPGNKPVLIVVHMFGSFLSTADLNDYRRSFIYFGDPNFLSFSLQYLDNDRTAITLYISKNGYLLGLFYLRDGTMYLVDDTKGDLIRGYWEGHANVTYITRVELLERATRHLNHMGIQGVMLR